MQQKTIVTIVTIVLVILPTVATLTTTSLARLCAAQHVDRFHVTHARMGAELLINIYQKRLRYTRITK